MADPEHLAMARARGREPRPCVVRLGSQDLPGILLEWRPKRGHGGLSRWEGLVIYASWTPATLEWRITQGWTDGDLLFPAAASTRRPIRTSSS